MLKRENKILKIYIINMVGKSIVLLKEMIGKIQKILFLRAEIGL